LNNLNEPQALHIPIVSDILKGPIPRGSVLVLFYEPSAQRLSFILTMVSELLKRGRVVGITTTSTPPAQIRQRLDAVMSNLKELELTKKLTLIDWYTWTTGKKSTESRSVDSLGLAQFNIQDSGYQKEDSPLYDFVAGENLSAFLKYNDERTFMQWLDKTFGRIREMKGIRLYCFLKHFHSDAFYANLEAMADGVIELDVRESQRRLENVIRLKSMNAVQHPTDWRTLRITKTGLLRIVSTRR